MEMQVLQDNVISQIRSTICVNNINQCVMELVLNSLDAKSTSIAIRINVQTFRIQVIDNGIGISRSNLNLIGQRYMSTKCHTLSDLKRSYQFHGYRGEALASIIMVSEKITITSRVSDSNETWTKYIHGNNSEIVSEKLRVSVGTTITIYGFLNLLPIRQRCSKLNNLEIVQKSIQNLSIIHPKVSFTLRNDATNDLILDCAKSDDIVSAFCNIHPNITDQFNILKVQRQKVSIKGLIHKKLHCSKKMQYIFVNKRPVTSSKIEHFLNNYSKKLKRQTDSNNKHLVYVLHIKCPYIDIDLNCEPTKTLVLFKKFDLIKQCLTKLLNANFGVKQAIMHENEVIKNARLKSDFGFSLIEGAVYGIGQKTKQLPENENESIQDIDNKRKLIDNSDCDEFIKKRFKLKKYDIENYLSLQTNETQLNNETSGKEFIMDMFIKSVNVYSKNSMSCSNFDTISRVESCEEVQKIGVSIGVQCKPQMLDAQTMTDFKPRTFEKECGSVNVCNKFNKNKLLYSNLSTTTKNAADFTFFPIDETNISLNNINLSPIPKLKETSGSIFLKPMAKSKFSSAYNVQESPYFLKKTLTIKPKIENKLKSDLNISKYFVKKCNSDCNELTLNSVSDFNTSDIEELSPIFENTINKSDKTYTQDLFTYNENKNESDLIITVNDKAQENAIIQRDLNFDNKDIKQNFITQGLSQDPDWIVQVNQFGKTIYKNKKTGVVSVTLPRKESNFQIMKRFEFIPKGQSPIIEQIQVDSFSTQARDHFQLELIKSFDDELLMIKWIKYLDNKDPKTFFDELYKEKSKLYEKNTWKSCNNNFFTNFESNKFTKTILKNLTVVGQVDYKFIAAFDKSKQFVLLFDQHAVNERVRLEDLQKSAYASVKLNQYITIFLPTNHLTLIKQAKASIEHFGLKFQCLKHGIEVSNVPLCAYYKFIMFGMVTFVENLIQEITEILISNNGIIIQTPTIIQNIVKMEACRYAIKFGDPLTIRECQFHLKTLSNCDLPFQCAHGRPTLVPLLTLQTKYLRKSKPQLFKLVH